MSRYKIEDIDNYMPNMMTDEKAKLLIKHCNKYNVSPCICAWYEDWDDFCSDWCDDIGYTKTEARELLNNKHEKGQFKKFKDGTICRLSM